MNKAIFELKPQHKEQKEGDFLISEPVQRASPNLQHKNYGKVPSYINKYHKEREEQLKRKAMEEEEAKHPPGTRLMPEEERV